MIGTLSIADKVYLASTLSVVGNTQMVGSLSVHNNVILSSQLSVGNNSTIAGTLSVAGESFINNALNVNNYLSIDGLNGKLYTSAILDNSVTPGDGLLTIDCGTLHIKGNLDVSGTYNTVDISTSSIHVEDKLIVLSTSSMYDGQQDINQGVIDGESVNDKAGIQVAGVPDAFPEGYTGSDPVYEKSMRWNLNAGFASMGYLQPDMTNDATLRDDEPFWECKGGAFHLAADQKVEDALGNVSVQTIKYGFRINPNGELEIIKKIGGDPSKRVAKFGITSAF